MPRCLSPGDHSDPSDTERLELTAWVTAIAKLCHDAGIVLGARIFPTEAQNDESGYAVREWMASGLLDYVTPMFYSYFVLDPDMPQEWVVEAAAGTDCSVYGFLQAYINQAEALHPTSEQMRAAAANFWAKGVDGLYSYFAQ